MRSPVYLLQNDYFVIEGINAHNSSTSVVSINESNHNIIRRVCGFDATDRAEVSGDAKITAYDAALIAQQAVGLISKFPVEP